MKFVSFTRLLVKNFQYQVYLFQFVKVYLKRYFYTIPQNKILAHINWKYELKLSILKPKKTGTIVNSSTELVICSLERSYYKRFNLSSTLNYMKNGTYPSSLYSEKFWCIKQFYLSTSPFYLYFGSWLASITNS